MTSHCHAHLHEAIQLMTRFADRTGLTSERPRQRYLWTDAFAVCNFLGIAHATGEGHYTELAFRLVDRVHHTLGKHRADDRRTGWISGLGDKEGESHPTRGGLRIGKKLPERGPGEPFDEQLEWDRDGQYFHYLTKWMHALDQLSRSAKQPRFNLWARELAETAYSAFSYQPQGNYPPSLVWKMSIDLSRPVVASMGQHDSLDGFVTYLQLQTTAAKLDTVLGGPRMKQQVAGFALMLEGGTWATADPLGIGGLLMDACRFEQLIRQEVLPNAELLCRVLAAALEGLRHYGRHDDLRLPASRRLGFRELGLAIGLHAIEKLAQPSRGSDLRALLAALEPYASLASTIESFWLDPEHRKARTWSEHGDINEVMLATSLIPEGCVILHSMN
jgi:hypothetical protein